MNKSVVVLIVAVAALGFVLRRQSDGGDRKINPSGQPSRAASEEPSLSPAPDRKPRRHQGILRYFATIHEENLPTQGVLGGTMVPGTIAFPKGFELKPGTIFYVVGSDGHLLESWTFEVIPKRFWNHTGAEQGYEPDDFEDRPAHYDVYLWRPAHYIPNLE